MRKIIINADDFGRTKDINEAIVKAHKEGVVTSATIMTTGKYFIEGTALANENTSLKVGLHLDLSEYFVIKHGEGRVIGYKDNTVKLGSIEKTMKKQIKEYKDAGLEFRHMDSHYHIHLREDLLPFISGIAKEHGLETMRFFKSYYNELGADVYARMKEELRKLDIKTTDHFVSGWNFDELSNLDDGLAIELMTHPGKEDEWRKKELESACADNTKKYFKDKHFRLISFEDL
ncbi:MAG: ChbG/HpnK family deacetylase [Elusimicrobiota bacterium]